MSRHKKRLREPLKYTLSELEELDWGSPTFESWLVQTVHRLRHVQLEKLTAGDLRLMIAQNVSLAYLVPLALEVLDADPFVDASYYPGDLLRSVLGIPQDFWIAYPAYASRAQGLARKVLSTVDTAAVEPELIVQLKDFIDV